MRTPMHFVKSKTVLALLLSGLILFGFGIGNQVRAQDWWGWVTSLPNDLSFGSGGGADPGGAAARTAELIKFLEFIRSVYGGTAVKDAYINELYESLNTASAIKYIESNDVYRSALLDKGLIDAKTGRVTKELIENFANNTTAVTTSSGNTTGQTATSGSTSSTSKTAAEIAGADSAATGSCLLGPWGTGNLEQDSCPSCPGYNSIMKNYWVYGADGKPVMVNGQPLVDVGKYSEDVGLTSDEIAAKYSASGGSSGSGTTSGGASGGSSSGAVSSATAAVPVKQAPQVTNTTVVDQSTANVPLSVSTDRTANCSYSLVSNFTFNTGSLFTTTGNYNHNADLENMAAGKHTYYVICEDAATGGVSPAIKIEFTVDLSKDPNNAPVIESTTPSIQTDAGPKLSVTTSRAAACQYKEAAPALKYGEGVVMTADADHRAHSVSIAALADAKHTFYVVCRDDATAAVGQIAAIETTLNRAAGDGAPVISGKTAGLQSNMPVILMVQTTRAADCKYKTGTFTDYDDAAATKFATTGGTEHSVQISGLADGSYTYYVICADTASGAKNKTPFEIKFMVSAAAPVISSTTSATQTGTDPKLSVTTTRGADCQYKKDNAFTFGNGAAMAQSNDGQSHEDDLSLLADGTYNFHIVCRDKSSGKDAEKIIETKLQRSDAASGAPAVTNETSGYQTVGNPVLRVVTDKDAECEYAASSFAWGSGKKFNNDGFTVHSQELSGLANGQHSYYVVCRAVSGGKTSPEGYQIIFTVNTAATGDVCASLASNDRKNDSNRDFRNTTANSVYPWQSVETGTREIFPKVEDWHAGYQFTSERDGQVTQLCGYFDLGVKNKVSLYNGTYSELASAEITGDGKWKCVDIDPVEIKMDGRYYVIARVKSNPVYFEFNESGMLPIDAGGVVIESGIRQTIGGGVFKTDIIKYDYMILGLVDVKISYVPAASEGPEISEAGPKGTIYNPSVSIEAETQGGAECRFDREDVDYEEMAYSLPKVSDGLYRQLVCGLEDGNYTFYVRCKDGSGEENDASKLVQFIIEQ